MHKYDIICICHMCVPVVFLSDFRSPVFSAGSLSNFRCHPMFEMIKDCIIQRLSSSPRSFVPNASIIYIHSPAVLGESYF